jgi:hypothetical protein
MEYYARQSHQIFVPLFFNLLFEAKGDREGNVVNYCLETLDYIVGHIIS